MRWSIGPRREPERQDERGRSGRAHAATVERSVGAGNPRESRGPRVPRRRWRPRPPRVRRSPKGRPGAERAAGGPPARAAAGATPSQLGERPSAARAEGDVVAPLGSTRRRTRVSSPPAPTAIPRRPPGSTRARRRGTAALSLHMPGRDAGDRPAARGWATVVHLQAGSAAERHRPALPRRAADAGTLATISRAARAAPVPGSRTRRATPDAHRPGMRAARAPGRLREIVHRGNDDGHADAEQHGEQHPGDPLGDRRRRAVLDLRGGGAPGGGRVHGIVHAASPARHGPTMRWPGRATAIASSPRMQSRCLMPWAITSPTVSRG